MVQITGENTTEVTLAARLGAVSGTSERAVAEYLLGLGSRAAAMSAREVASATGTSDATVVRTAQSLGLLLGRLREECPRLQRYVRSEHWMVCSRG